MVELYTVEDADGNTDEGFEPDPDYQVAKEYAMTMGLRVIASEYERVSSRMINDFTGEDDDQEA